MTAQPPPSLDEIAVALVTGHLTDVPPSVLTAIVADADSDALALYLAAALAFVIDETTGGERWLRRWGLAVAAEGAGC